VGHKAGLDRIFVRFVSLLFSSLKYV